MERDLDLRNAMDNIARFFGWTGIKDPALWGNRIGKAKTIACNCYVAALPDIDRFTLRYGAHGLDCPVYRESGDPVDRLKDEETRARLGP